MSAVSNLPMPPALAPCLPDFGFSACRLPARLARCVVLGLLFSLVFLPEYVQGRSDPTAKSFLYQRALSGFRFIDIAILLLSAVHAIALSCSRRKSISFPRAPLLMAAGFGGSIIVSACYGALHGGENLFFDWRAMALGVCLYVVYGFWVQSAADAQRAMTLFGIYVAARIAILLAFYTIGRGDLLLGVRIPVFDGPTLSAIVCAGVIGLGLSGRDSDGKRRRLWLPLSGAACLVVALSFRRTYWAELLAGAALLVVVRKQQALRSFVILAASVAVAALILGTAFYSRLQSLDFTDGDSHYSADNSDHVGDVLDAWEEVQRAPLAGLGLGRSYPTWRIRDWKDESVMVHNAPLHVWLKYGLLGLFFFILYHITLFRELRHRQRNLASAQATLVTVVLAYLAAQSIVSLGFTPWPYSSVQSANLIAFLLAVAFAKNSPCHDQRFPLSHPPSTVLDISKTRSSA